MPTTDSDRAFRAAAGLLNTALLLPPYEDAGYLPVTARIANADLRRVLADLVYITTFTAALGALVAEPYADPFLGRDTMMDRIADCSVEVARACRRSPGQIGDRHAECVGEPVRDAYRWVLHAPFDVADAVRTDPAALRQLLAWIRA